MPRVDAEARQLRADDRDVGVGLGVALVRPAPDRREQAEVLELLRELARDAGAAAELVEVDRLDPLAQRRPGARRLRSVAPGAASSSRITRSGRNSSRCSRRIVTSRSTSCSLKRR